MTDFNMVVRLTNKLFKRIKEKPPVEIWEEPNPFLDWAADHFTVGGYRFIIIANCASVLSWVSSAKGINDSRGFIKCIVEAQNECMKEYGFDFHWERIIAPSSRKFYFRKVADPRMSGILTDLTRHAKYHLYDGLSPYEASLLLNEMPQCSRKESFPIRAFQKLNINQ